MKELIHVSDDRGRLHCDNGECGHVLPAGAVTWGEHLIGYPCPRCSSDMLTRRDYEDSERIVMAARWVNKWFGWLGKEYDGSNAALEISVRNHDGKLIVKKDDEP